MLMRWKQFDWSLISIRIAKVLVEEIAGDAVEVRKNAVVSYVCALGQLARNSIDRLVGELQRGNTASTLEVFHDPAANMLVLLPRAVDI